MDKMKMRELLPSERLYVYSQSPQICGLTGEIGYLRGDFGEDGDKFWTTWFEGAHKGRKTDAFYAEFDEVINAMRQGILKSRSALLAYSHNKQAPPARFGDGRIEFGIRIDTEKFAYLLRCNPVAGNYNFYCYCYVRQSLDRHLEKAAKGIRFITPEYKEKFRISDGDEIRITSADGTRTDKVCRYIDECHVEVGCGVGNLFHICQFAEIMECNGNTVIPLRSSLSNDACVPMSSCLSASISCVQSTIRTNRRRELLVCLIKRARKSWISCARICAD